MFLAPAPKRKLPPPPKETSEYKIAYYLYTAQIDPPEEAKVRTESVMKTCAHKFECKAVYVCTLYCSTSVGFDLTSLLQFDAKQQKAADESPIRCFFDGSDGILPQNNRYEDPSLSSVASLTNAKQVGASL